MNVVFTFSRRCGSGASVIIDELSKRYDLPVYDKKYILSHVEDPDSVREQSDLIRKLAQEPCIIVGRGASEVLKDQSNAIHIYIYADKDFRIRRVAENDGLTLEEAAEKVRRIDHDRSEYYHEATGKYWGDFDNYNLILDSSVYGIERCADIITQFLENSGIV